LRCKAKSVGRAVQDGAWNASRVTRLLVAALLLVVLHQAGPAAARETTPISQATLIRGVIASVVNISARIRSPEPSGAPQAGTNQPAQSYKVLVSAGSGFVIDAGQGYIATNNHVVENGRGGVGALLVLTAAALSVLTTSCGNNSSAGGGGTTGGARGGGRMSETSHQQARASGTERGIGAAGERVRKSR